MKAHASGMRELQISQLAATRATNPQVKTYAQQLVSEHQQMAQEMKPLLTSAGLDAAMATGVMSSGSSSSGSGSSTSGSATYSSGGGASGTGGTAGAGAAGTSATGSAGSYPSGATAGGTAAGSGSGSASARETDTSGSAHTSSGKSGSMRDRWTRMMSDRKQQKLAEKTGADFDKAYINLMVDEHQDAVDLFEDAIEDNANPQVQAFATKYLPKLQQHLAQAKQIEDAVK